MVIIPKKNGDREPIRIKNDSSSGIYGNAPVDSECHMITQNWKMQ